MGDHPAVITVVMPKPDTHVTLKSCRKSNVCCLPRLTNPLWGCKIKELFNIGSALYLLSEKVITIPAKKWGDTGIAERGRSVLVMRARYRSAGLTPHQRGWTDAG